MRGKPTVPAVPNKIAVVGEAWGADEDREKASFVGKSGRELTRMLSQAGIERSQCLLTNVFLFRPINNEIKTLCTRDRTSITYPEWWPHPPALVPGYYLRSEYMDHVLELSREIDAYDPNVVIALGNTPLWALCGHTGIGKARGAVCTTGPHWPGKVRKVLPTYHPAFVLRRWDQRVVVVADLIKALRESLFPEVRRPERELWLDPEIKDLWDFHDLYIKPQTLVAADLENPHGFIECISFSPDPKHSLIVPFIDRNKEGWHYWKTQEEELEAWRFCLWLLRDCPFVRILGQNFTYDTQVIYREIKAFCLRYSEDTMIKQHSQLPGMPKALDFLGSLHTDEVAWKTHRPRGHKLSKREE